MKWYINQFNQFRNKGIIVDEMVDVSELEKTSDIRRIPPVHVKGHGDFGSNKITFTLTIEGTMILPCSRTLKDATHSFTIETTETYLLSPEGYGQPDEENLHQVEGEVLDLMPMIKENILLEIPLQIYCDDPSLEGGAPQSGKGWQVVSENEQKDRIDPRFLALKDFFNDNKNND
ncbi:YceD family protein [Schinkia sp. CFF1]